MRRDAKSANNNTKKYEIWRMMTRTKISSKFSSVGGSASGRKSQKSPPKEDPPLEEKVKTFKILSFKLKF